MGPNLSAPPHCRCCNEQHRHRGGQRGRERVEWQADYIRGEFDGDQLWPGEEVHDLKEPGSMCDNWSDHGSGDGAWDYEQEDVPFWWYQAIIPAERRLPHLTTAW